MIEVKTKDGDSRSALERVVIRASRVLFFLGCAILMMMMLLSTADVAGRFLANRPIEGAYELIGFSLLLIIAAGLAHCQLEQGNVRVTIIYDRWPEKTRKALDIMALLVGSICSALICWQLFELGRKYLIRKSGGLTETLNIPIAPFIIIEGLGFAFLTFVLILSIYASVARHKERK